MQTPPGPPPPPQPPSPPGPVGEEVLFRSYPAATPLVWLRWLVTLGIYELFRRRTEFVVTTRRVLVRHGMLHRTERSLPIGRIQDINTRKGLFTGYVDLSSAGGTLGIESFGPLWNASVKRMAEAIEQLIAA